MEAVDHVKTGSTEDLPLKTMPAKVDDRLVPASSSSSSEASVSASCNSSSELQVPNASYNDKNAVEKAEKTVSEDKEGVPPDSVTLVHLDSQQRREYLKHQIEFYFSRENLAQDAFLVSQMDNDQYVPVELIASFNNVRRLVDDLPTLLDVIRESKQLQVDSSGTRVRPMFQRSIVVMREVARDVTEEQVTELFNGADAQASKCPPCTSVEYADNGCWYVSFDTQSEAQKALEYVRMKTFCGAPVMARLKAVPLARGALAFNRQFLASSTSQQQGLHGSPYQGSPNRISPLSGASSIDISPLHFGAHIIPPSAAAAAVGMISDSFLPEALSGDKYRQQQTGTAPVRIMPTPIAPLVSTSAPPPSAHLPLLPSPQQHQRQSIDATTQNLAANTDYRQKNAAFNTSGFYSQSAMQHVPDSAGQPPGDAADDYSKPQHHQHPGGLVHHPQQNLGYEFQHNHMRLGSTAPPSGSTQSSPRNSNYAESESQIHAGHHEGEWNNKAAHHWQSYISPYHYQQNNIASQVITPEDADAAAGSGFMPHQYASDPAAAVAAAAFIQQQYMSGNAMQYAEPPLLNLVPADYPASASLLHDPNVAISSAAVDDSSGSGGNARVLSDASYFQPQASPYAAYYQQAQQQFGAGAAESMLLAAAAAAAGYTPNNAGVYQQQSLSGSPHQQQQQQQQQQWNNSYADQQHASSVKRYGIVNSRNRSPTTSTHHDIMAEHAAMISSNLRFNDNTSNIMSSSSTLNPPHHGASFSSQQSYSTSSLPSSNRRRSYRNTATNTMQHDTTIPPPFPASQSSSSSSSLRFNGNPSSLPPGQYSANRLPSPMRDDSYAAVQNSNMYGQPQQQQQPSNYRSTPKTNNYDSTSSSGYRAAQASYKGHRDAAAGGDANNSTAVAGFTGQQDYGQFNYKNKFYSSGYKGKESTTQQYSGSAGTDSAVSSLASSNGNQPPPLSDSSGYAGSLTTHGKVSTTSRISSDSVGEYRRAADYHQPRGRGDAAPLDRNVDAVRGKSSGADGAVMMSNTPRRPNYESGSKEYAGYNNDNSGQYGAASRYQGGASAKSGSFSDNKRNSAIGESEATTTRASSTAATAGGGAAPFVRLSPTSSNAASKSTSLAFGSASSVGQPPGVVGPRKPPVATTAASPRAAAYSQKMQSARAGGNDADYRPPSFELAGNAFPPLPTPNALKTDAHQISTTTADSSTSTNDVSLPPPTATTTASSEAHSAAASHQHSATNAWLQPKTDSRLHAAALQAHNHHFPEPQHYHSQRTYAASSNSSSNGNMPTTCWSSSASQQPQQSSRYPFPQQPPPQQSRKPYTNNKVDKCVGTQDMPFMPRETHAQLIKLIKSIKTNNNANGLSNGGGIDAAVELTEQQQRQNDEMYRLLEELTLGGNVVLANEIKQRFLELNAVQALNASSQQKKTEMKEKTNKSVAAQTDEFGTADHVASVHRQQSFSAKGKSMEAGDGDASSGKASSAAE